MKRDGDGRNLGDCGMSATLPNEQGMGVPGQVDLLKKEKQWKHTSKKQKG